MVSCVLTSSLDKHRLCLCPQLVLSTGQIKVMVNPRVTVFHVRTGGGFATDKENEGHINTCRIYEQFHQSKEEDKQSFSEETRDLTTQEENNMSSKSLVPSRSSTLRLDETGRESADIFRII